MTRRKKDKQHNDQKKKDKQRSKNRKEYTENERRATRIPPKTWGELWCSESESTSCSTSDTRRVTLVTNPEINHEKEQPSKTRGCGLSLCRSPFILL